MELEWRLGGAGVVNCTVQDSNFDLGENSPQMDKYAQLHRSVGRPVARITMTCLKLERYACVFGQLQQCSPQGARWHSSLCIR
ncbi:hypothetical protein Mapa_008398 [Marchantia paleacea]|nr:hypothetical protein Mapa_008398 [Marchantia paleacea]